MVKWQDLWEALRKHGMSDHMFQVLRCICYSQMGDLSGLAGQGSELNPQLFSGFLEDAGAGRLAMPVWIFKMACDISFFAENV